MEWKLVKRDCIFCSRESVLLKQVRHTKKTEAVTFFKKEQEAIENMQKMTLTKSVSCINEVAQSCLILCKTMVHSLPDSSVHGIFQARVLQWVAISFSRRSCQPRNWTQVSCIADQGRPQLFNIEKIKIENLWDMFYGKMLKKDKAKNIHLEKLIFKI